MELFNIFFVSYNIVKGPKVIYVSNNQIGVITFYPSKKNIFFSDEGRAFVFDDKKISLSDKMIKFVNYTGLLENDFEKFCLNIWEEEFGIIETNIY